MQIPLSRPDLSPRAVELVNRVVRSDRLSMGKMLERFERDFAEYIGTGHAVAVNSGTSGLHLLIRSLGIGEGDQVITTPFSFIASSNCILFEQAEPVFVDIDPRTLCIDPQKIEEAITEKTKAILPVDVFGQPADMTSIIEIAEKHDLLVIADSCEAIGAEHEGKKVGTYTESVFAFYPNKQMTTGEGGMIVTDDPEVAGLCRSMRNQGRADNGGWLDHIRLGYNYRLDEMSCALGVAQLERIDELLDRREQVAELYSQLLSGIEEVEVPFIDEKTTRMSWFVYVIRLKGGMRDQVMRYLKNEGIACKAYFPPIHLQPLYRERFGCKRGDYPICEQTGDSVLALPFYGGLKPEEVERVVLSLKEALV